MNTIEREIWKVIEDSPNYSVSNFGRVKNHITDKEMRITVKGGYGCISLINNSKKTQYKVHRLVAKAFIPNPENKSDVNHKDMNKINNNVNNLEWNTRKENNGHRCSNLKIVNKAKNKKIARLDKKTNEILELYDSIKNAGDWAYENGLTKNSHNGRNAIGNCLTKNSFSAYNFKWEFQDTYGDLENEIWKQVLVENMNSDKKYFVSNLGRFKNSNGIIRNHKTSIDGYKRVFIYNKTYFIHRLIAIAFLSNPENKEHVNHIDGVKTNNNLSNLEWVTPAENNLHKHKIGLGNCHTKKIGQYDLEGNFIKEHISIASASREIGKSKSGIQGVLTNYRKTCGGFIWKYLD